MPIEHIEFLVEELSAEEALKLLVPRICGASFAIHTFQGKPDLLAKVEDRLRGYRDWLPENWGVVVLIDEDREDCKALKGKLEQAARAAGLTTKSRTSGGRRFQVLNRIAVEELEAWFLGDVPALVAAYPGVPTTLGSRARFRSVDSIPGGTWEALERVLKAAGHYQGGLQKTKAARDIAENMDPARNTSPSFQAFASGLVAMCGQP